jgi:hypothetical protein
LFSILGNRLLRGRLSYQKEMKTIVGEIRGRCDEGWELVSLLVSVVNPIWKEISPNTLTDELFKLSWKATSLSLQSPMGKKEEIRTINKAIDEILSKIHNIEETVVDSGNTKTSKISLEEVLKSQHLGEYIDTFLEHNITVSQFRYLRRDDIAALIPRIGDRLRFEAYLQILRKK